MPIMSRRSVLRASFGAVAAGMLARPYIANAAATTARLAKFIPGSLGVPPSKSTTEKQLGLGVGLAPGDQNRRQPPRMRGSKANPSRCSAASTSAAPVWRSTNSGDRARSEAPH